MPSGWVIGVDFGGTNVKCGLVNARGQVVDSVSFASAQYSRPAAFVTRIGEAVDSLLLARRIHRKALLGIGVGAPGPVDGERGVVHMLVNVPGWCNVPLAKQLTRRVGVRAFIDNDVNLVALGEWRFGAGQGARNLIALTLGTGVGGGLVIEGKLFRGSTGTAGELGHMVIDPHGMRCGCGTRGCLEAHVGTAAILHLGRRAIRRGVLTPELIAHAAQRGDRRAQRVWQVVGYRLGIGLGNLVNLLNPDRIVIGGGVANAWKWFAPTMMQTMQEQAMEVPMRSVRVMRAKLGKHAGIAGAAVLVWNELGDQ